MGCNGTSDTRGLEIRLQSPSYSATSSTCISIRRDHVSLYDVAKQMIECIMSMLYDHVETLFIFNLRTLEHVKTCH